MNFPVLGSCWFVSNKTQIYVARVVGYAGTRVLIVNDELPSNIRQTPTHADLLKFDTGDGGEYMCVEMP